MSEKEPQYNELYPFCFSVVSECVSVFVGVCICVGV